jgi:hypothetical protein
MCFAPRHPSNGTVVTVAPMAKKDAVCNRLAEEIALAKSIDEGIKDSPSPGLLDLATPDEKEKLAASLWLNEKDPFFGPILDAFRAFGLDHRNDGDWHKLVFHLARVLFPKRRPSGPQRKWTDERRFQLLADVAAYKRKRPKASDAEICGWLHRKSYPDESSDGLRRALHDARNPKRNSELAQMADLVERTATGNWTRAHDEAAIAKRVSWVIENADALADALWGPRK